MWGRNNTKANAYFNEGTRHLKQNTMDKALLAYYQAHQQGHLAALDCLKGILESCETSKNSQQLKDISKPKLFEIIEAAYKDDPADELRILKACAQKGNDLGDKFHYQRYFTECTPETSDNLKKINNKIEKLEKEMGVEMKTLQKPKSGM